LNRLQDQVHDKRYLQRQGQIGGTPRLPGLPSEDSHNMVGYWRLNNNAQPETRKLDPRVSDMR